MGGKSLCPNGFQGSCGTYGCESPRSLGGAAASVKQAVDKVDAATTDVGARMTEAAQTIREKAPMSGPVADAASTAATTLERAGTYLQQQDLADMRADLEGIIRRHPMESLLIGLGIGYLLARSTRR